MGLYDGRMTNFMSCLEGMDVYSDQDVASKVVKAVTDRREIKVMGCEHSFRVVERFIWHTNS